MFQLLRSARVPKLAPALWTGRHQKLTLCAVVLQARQQAKEMLWMRQSENMVLEAMTRLSAVHDALEEMLGANANTTEAATSLRSNASGRQTFRR